MVQGINAVIHGDAKVGKSWLGDTTPAPRLVIDAEGSSRFTPSRKVMWNPQLENPPEVDGTWDTCVVAATTYDIFNRTYQWLNSGQHPFESFVIDQLTETQRRIMADLVGMSAMRQQDWGELLRRVEDLISKYRDLTWAHPIKTLKAGVFISGTHEKNGVFKPLLSGGIGNLLPYMVDLLGYMYIEADSTGVPQRKLLISKHPQYDSGTRIHQLTEKYGSVIVNPSIDDMINAINAQAEAA